MNDEKKREEAHRLRVELEAAAHRTEEARLAAASAIAKLVVLASEQRAIEWKLHKVECPICSLAEPPLTQEPNRETN